MDQEHEKIFSPLPNFLSDYVFNIITAPYILTKEKMSDWLYKYLSPEIDNIFIVGWRQSNDPIYVNFSDLLNKITTNRNSLFIIEDIITFTGYIGEINQLGYTNNFYLMIIDTVPEPTQRSLISKYFPDAMSLWAAPLDVPIDMVYNKKEDLITGGQLKQYQESFMNWRKLSHESYGKIDPPSSLLGTLNVFLDQKISSLESQPKDIAFQRSPKFKNILQGIIFHRKKRHFVSMISGERGITAFESLFGKLDMDIPIHVIKNSDPMSTKESKLEDINSSNAPLVVVSDYHFTDDMAIKNIDYYHITSGGKLCDIISILSFLKGTNYTGTYPRKLHVNNYVSETPSSELAMDAVAEREFFGRIQATMEFKKTSKVVDLNVVLVEDKLFVVVEDS